MDASDRPSPPNSKVIIQCTDPNDVFARLEPRLSPRSPLRNLHWKAPNRPLRSIANLNFTLTREDKSTGAQSNVRRHQIPGLRETPYVKVYLLRCDDKEAYKEKARKEIRQWVKAQTPAGDSKSSGKNQEDHDAFEWLILHVVLPNTPAASQSKSSRHISLEASESTDSVNSKSKWPGKGSSTIFDKLRADFNSSKSSIARVAQVRLLEPGDKSTALTASELEEQWHDLVDSLKACILRSFDARVAQYESDIRERDSQRALPGWNFCTFFVLKEGLARGFESLGLLEDALGVYDELSLGLDVLVKEQAQKDDHDDSGALLTFSKESKALLRDALNPGSQDSPPLASDFPLELKQILAVDRDSFPFDVDKKDYRNLILSNDVSALDLRIYLFTREIEVLGQQARSDVVKSSHSNKVGANPDILADVTERATQFISLAGRALRFELYHAWGGQEGLTDDELHNQRTVTGNIVSTWQWRAAMQILSQCLPTLDLDAEHSVDALSLGANELSYDSNSEFASLSYDYSGGLQRMPLGPNAQSNSRERSEERRQRNFVLQNGVGSRPSITAHPGLQRLALWISKLVLMTRHTLESLEASKRWAMDMNQSALELDESSLATNSLNGEDDRASGEEGRRPSNTELLVGLKSSSLEAGTFSKHNFTHLYAMLSVFAFRAVSVAGAGQPRRRY